MTNFPWTLLADFHFVNWNAIDRQTERQSLLKNQSLSFNVFDFKYKTNNLERNHLMESTKLCLTRLGKKNQDSKTCLSFHEGRRNSFLLLFMSFALIGSVCWNTTNFMALKAFMQSKIHFYPSRKWRMVCEQNANQY